MAAARALGRAHFKDQMGALERSALGGLDMALGQLDRVLDALRASDLRLAQFVVADDARIDGRYLEVHQGVLSLLALQGPVAGDLRLVTAVLHVINNIERIGDQCVNIAKLIPLCDHEPAAGDLLLESVLRMGALARDESSQARRAFAQRDLTLAESLAAQDLQVDRLNRDIFHLAVQAGEDPALREWAITMTHAARALERIGDNAVDIGEQAVFVATGEFRELTRILNPPPSPAVEPRSHFQDELLALEQRSLGALDLVLAALDRVIEALAHQDVELAQIVVDEDVGIDAVYVDVHHTVISLLALHAPVASDLRLLAALLHLVRFAERMGNQCVSVAKLIPLSGHEPPIRDEILTRVVRMGHFARAEVVQCRRSFAERNVPMAEDLVNRDREVNRLNREIFRLAVESGDDSDTREWAMTMTLVARAFERVGDNAVDVGEQTGFVSTGLFRELADVQRARGQ